jgi:DNA primase
VVGVSIFELLREQVSLEELLDVKTGGKARCVAPGHEDIRPSMHNYGDHVHCFACGLHGDVVDVWDAMRGFGHPIEAARDLAREYNIELPEWLPEAERKAEEWRKREAECMREAEERHRGLERHLHMREWWRSRGFDEELQKRYLLGASADGRAAAIPFWHRGRVQGIILRNLDEDEPKYMLPEGESLPDGRRPLFIPGRVSSDSYVVEGSIDALALDALGESVVAVGGTHPNEAQLRELKRLPGGLYILFDDDKAGHDAARELARKLYPKARICPARYGEGSR